MRWSASRGWSANRRLSASRRFSWAITATRYRGSAMHHSTNKTDTNTNAHDATQPKASCRYYRVTIASLARCYRIQIPSRRSPSSPFPSWGYTTCLKRSWSWSSPSASRGPRGSRSACGSCGSCRWCDLSNAWPGGSKTVDVCDFTSIIMLCYTAMGACGSCGSSRSRCLTWGDVWGWMLSLLTINNNIVHCNSYNYR